MGNKDEYRKAIEGLNNIYKNMGVDTWELLYDRCNLSNETLGTALGVYKSSRSFVSSDVLLIVATELMKLNKEFYAATQDGTKRGCGRPISDANTRAWIAPLLVYFLLDESREYEEKLKAAYYMYAIGDECTKSIKENKVKESEENKMDEEKKVSYKNEQYATAVSEAQSGLRALLSISGVSVDTIAQDSVTTINVVNSVISDKNPEPINGMPVAMLKIANAITKRALTKPDCDNFANVAGHMLEALGRLINSYYADSDSVGVYKELIATIEGKKHGANSADEAEDEVKEDEVKADPEFIQIVTDAKVGLQKLTLLTHCNFDVVAREANISVEELYAVLGRNTASTSWPIMWGKIEYPINMVIVAEASFKLIHDRKDWLTTATRVAEALKPLQVFIDKYYSKRGIKVAMDDLMTRAKYAESKAFEAEKKMVDDVINSAPKLNVSANGDETKRTPYVKPAELQAVKRKPEEYTTKRSTISESVAEQLIQSVIRGGGGDSYELTNVLVTHFGLTLGDIVKAAKKLNQEKLGK